MFDHINELSVLVVTLLGMAISTIWYSPLLFGTSLAKPFHHANTGTDFSKQQILKNTLISSLVHFIFFLFLAYFLALTSGVPYSVFKISLLLTILVALCIAMITVHEEKPYAYFGIHAGYIGTLIISGAQVITLWPW